MFPTLFQWGPITLHTYGLFAAFGVLAGYTLAHHMARERGYPPQLLSDALVPLLLGGLLGARAFYVLFHAGEFAGQWGSALKFWQGGLMWQGGLVGGLGSLLIFLYRRHQPFLPLADLLAPAAALGQAVGRWGCLFAGCCYGRVCDLPWAVTFHHAEGLAPLNQPLHPTQIYDSGLQLVIALVLWGVSKSPWSRRSGQLAGLYLFLSGAARLAVEPFRADARGPGWGSLAGTGIVALGLLLAGVALLAVLRRSKPT